MIDGLPLWFLCALIALGIPAMFAKRRNYHQSQWQRWEP